jgi:sensor histidine kinase YesM
MIYFDHKLTLFLWGFVCSGLIIYFLISTLTYVQTKQKTFLYYGLYNIFLFVYMLKSSVLFTEEQLSTFFESRYGALRWLIQILYNSMLYLFYREFLEMNTYFPKQTKKLNQVIAVFICIAIVLFLISIVLHQTQFYFYFFNYIFVPFITIFVGMCIFISLKIPNKLKYFMILGVILYQGFAYLSLYISNNNNNDKSFTSIDPIIYFYIGIIVESIIFILGIGFKVQQIFNEKINAQKIIIEEQKEIQLLKENYQKELETDLASKVDELKIAIQKTEDEKLKSLTIGFENEVSNLKLDSLRSQMNPHFIFNALNSIKAYLIDNNTEKAVYYLNKFSKLIRKILESSRSESISLQEELDIIELYMSIENIRFEQKIDFNIAVDCTINLAQIKIPGLVLQPFIENSLWHGLMLKEGIRTIDLEIYKENDLIKLSVTDNGIGRNRAKENKEKKTFKKDSLGLQFAKERIDYFNRRENTNYNFKIIDLYDDDKKSIGTRVEFELNYAITT